NTSHLAASQQGMDFVVDNYGSRVPLGFTHFDNNGGACTVGVVVSPEPRTNNAALLKNDINGTVAGGSGNLGNAGDAVAADPRLHPSGRSRFWFIVTAGAGNWETTDPAFSVTQIDNTAKASQPIKTYIVAVEPATMIASDEQAMTLMANAGQRPC